jgi:bacterioferritin
VEGNQKVLAALNQLLSDELTAINQYMVHSEMCANWGYGRLHEAIEKQAVEEMHHAEWLIARILFLEGTPIVSSLGRLRIGSTVPEIVGNDQESEVAAVRAYNEAVALAAQLGDNGTRELLERILKDEERHEDWGEIQVSQLQQMGTENYLAQQLAG